MQNNIKKVGLVILVLVVIGAIFYLYQYLSRPSSKDMVTIQVSTTTPEMAASGKDIMTSDEKASFNLPNIGIYQVVSRDASGQIVDFKFIGMTPPKPIEPEFMTPEEKKLYHIGNFQVQILNRNSSGEITAYHVLKDETDIITHY